MRAVGISDIGLLRKKNEDSFLVDQDRGLFLVCDGMGGHKGGDVASKLAIEIIDRNIPFESGDEAIPALNKAISRANEIIWGKGRSHPELHDMGTTVTAAILRDSKLVVANVGDSSLFLMNSEKISKVTRDHTLAETMMADGLIKQGDSGSSAYSHILTRAVGVEKKVLIDVFTREVNQGDTIIMCSDGLTDLLEEQDIFTLIHQNEDISQAARALLDLALSRGGHDNTTIILIRI